MSGGYGIGVGILPYATDASPVSAKHSLWTPRQDAGVTAWWECDPTLKAPDGSAAYALNAGNVSQWTDLKGYSRHITQGNAVRQPPLVTQGRGGYVDMDGSNHCLVGAGAPFTFVQPGHWMIAGKWTWVAGAAYLFNGTSATSGVYASGGSTAVMYAGSAGPSKAFTNDTWYIWEFVFDGASSKSRLNGGAWATGNAGTNNPGGVCLGAAAAGANHAKASFYGILRWGAVQADAHCLTARRYLQRKAGESLIVI